MDKISISMEEFCRMGELINLPVEQEAAQESLALAESWLNEGNAFVEMMSDPQFADLAPAALIAFDR